MPLDDTPFGGSSPEVDRLLWRLAMDAAGVGVFDWDLETGRLRWDERLLDLFGLDAETFGGTIEAFNAHVHPDDLDRVTRALTEAIESVGAYEAEYRIELSDGEVRWIRARGRALPGPGGAAVRLVGAAFNSTATQDEDARVSRVLEAMPSAFFHLDRSWRFTYVNAVAQKLLGAVSTSIEGHVIWELFPDAVGSDFERYYRGAVETGQPTSFEAYYPPPLDEWYEVRAWPTPDGLSVYFLDISKRRAAQEALARAARQSTLLADVTQALADTLDPEEGVAALARLLVPELGDWCIITLVDGPVGATPEGWRRQLRDIGGWHADPERRPLVERYARNRLAALEESSFLFRGLQQSGPIPIEGDATTKIAAVLRPGPARDVLHELAPESAVVVPLRGRGRTNGLLTVFRAAGQPAFGAAELDFLRDVAGRAGLALENARAYAEQRDLAEGLQRSLLTAPPEPDHLHVAVRYAPAADAAQVGGDWYDSFVQRSGATNVVIGDVVGHDTAAAAAMGQVRSLLRGIAMTTDEGPADVLHRVDEVIAGLQVDTTASVVVARFEQTDEERAEGLTRMRWSNAGHPPPLMAVVRERDDDEALDPVDVDPGDTDRLRVEVRELWGADSDLLMGLFPDAERSETEVVLPRGATILLYTDGLVERRGQDLDEGVAALATVLGDLVASGMPLEETCDELLRRMLPQDPDDDVALVAVRLHREDRPRPAEAGPRVVPPLVAP